MRQNYDQPIKFQVNYATGEIDGFTQGTNTYWYRKNQQGDVTGIFSINYGNTALFVEYEYDAWGNVISITGDGASTIGQTNPIRYRGYFYDTETGYYYLNSRYYDPVTHRFLNGDVFASTGQGVLGCNMFAYCQNNPITYYDPSGTWVVERQESMGACFLAGPSYSYSLYVDGAGNVGVGAGVSLMQMFPYVGVACGYIIYPDISTVDDLKKINTFSRNVSTPIGTLTLVYERKTEEVIGYGYSYGENVPDYGYNIIAPFEEMTTEIYSFNAGEMCEEILSSVENVISTKEEENDITTGHFSRGKGTGRATITFNTIF